MQINQHSAVDFRLSVFLSFFVRVCMKSQNVTLSRSLFWSRQILKCYNFTNCVKISAKEKHIRDRKP